RSIRMGFADRSVVALLVLLLAAPTAHAAKTCTDTSNFEMVMSHVEGTVPCASATKHGKYVKQAKKALGRMLTGACKKQFVKRFLANSTCGRPDFVVCCGTNKKGKDISKVVKASKCQSKKGKTLMMCPDTDPTTVGEGCTSGGACVTTTSTTTSTTTTTSSTTTTTHPGPPPSRILDFAVSAAGGTCGDTRDGSNAVLKNLTCGGLSIGAGGSLIPEGPTPDGSVSRFALDCTGDSCTIGPTFDTPAPNVA